MLAIMRDGKQAIHWEKAKSDLRKNYRYCKKDGDFITNIAEPYMTYNEAKKIVDLPVEERTLEEFDRAALHVAMFEEYDVCTVANQQRLNRAYQTMCKEYYMEPAW